MRRLALQLVLVATTCAAGCNVWVPTEYSFRYSDTHEPVVQAPVFVATHGMLVWMHSEQGVTGPDGSVLLRGPSSGPALIHVVPPNSEFTVTAENGLVPDWSSMGERESGIRKVECRSRRQSKSTE